MTMRGFGDFGITVGFDVDRATVAVRGDVDALTAPTLGAILGVLAEQSHPNLVLDLAALTFIDAAGLGVIAGVSERLATSDRVLTVRATPAHARRVLEITGVDALVRFETPTPAAAALGAEQRSDDHSGAVHTQPADLAADLARVGMKPNEAVIDAALRLVTALAGSTVEGADGVSVTLERDGRLATVASSNDTVVRMDDHQYTTGQGPCLAAAAEGHWFHIESLANEGRWPQFVPRAIEEGIASILSTPLMTGERAVGALNIYSNSERAFGPRQQELAAMFASQASGILIDAGADVIDEALGKRILDGLLARETIARAEGMLMAREHVTAEQAAATLHRSARTAAATVLLYAAEIVASACEESEADSR
jgi:anti-anti-sigma factor